MQCHANRCCTTTIFGWSGINDWTPLMKCDQITNYRVFHKSDLTLLVIFSDSGARTGTFYRFSTALEMRISKLTILFFIFDGRYCSFEKRGCQLQVQFSPPFLQNSWAHLLANFLNFLNTPNFYVFCISEVS